MHKKLEAELVSLAHSILQMKDKEQAIALKEKAKDLYEKLSVLVFVEEYINTNSSIDKSKEELLNKLQHINDILEADKPIPQQDIIQEVNKTIQAEVSKPVQEEEEDNIFEPKFDSVRIDILEVD